MVKSRKNIPFVNLPGETWFPIPGYEGFYELSNKQRVKSLKREYTTEKILRPGWHSYGYPKYTLRKDGKNWYTQLHRLMAIVFLPNPDNLPCINHIDNNPKNNAIENLEWCTWSHNSRHAYKQERLTKVGEKNHMAKLKENEVLYIFNFTGDKTVLEKKYKISRQTVNDIKAGRRWYLITGKRHPSAKIRICEQITPPTD